MNPKVSILVPIYKTSKYIEKCVESLFNQTLDSIEYIFVNDATPDDAIEKLNKIIYKYPSLQNKIKLIEHVSNSGLAVSRNTALDAANGDYILVVDSDDYIELDMVEVLYYKAFNDNADIVVCDFFIEYSESSRISSDYISDNKEENIKNIIKHEVISSSLWNKLVKRDLYLKNDCRVPQGMNYCEDWHVSIRLFYYANKISKVNEPFYHYMQNNPNSITKTITQAHFDNIIKFWSLLTIFLKEKKVYDKYKQEIQLSRIQSKVRLMVGTSKSELRKKYGDLYRKEEMNYISRFKRGEKLMLLFIHFKMFVLAQALHNYLVFKNNKI